MNAKIPSAIAIFGAACQFPAQAGEVVLDYEATAQTVTGMPFGMEVPRLTKVTGVFVYQSEGTADTNPSPDRGNYQLTDGGDFEATFLGHKVTGSSTPFLQVEDIQVSPPPASIDTFRFLDGDDPLNRGGVMSFDGAKEPRIKLFFAMTDGAGQSFIGDSLPALYPMVFSPGNSGLPHTFTLGDADGGMNLQLTSLVQRSGRAPHITRIEFESGIPRLSFRTRPGAAYSIEFSTNLEAWDTVVPLFFAACYNSTFVDSGIATRLGALPDEGYYRVSEVE